MAKSILGEKDLLSIISEQHEAALTKSQEFFEALNNLQYEGKVSFGRNMKVIEKSVEFFRREFSPHIRKEEEIVFPFLTTHVPRLDPVLRFLSAEHTEIRSQFKSFEHRLHKIKDIKDAATLDKDVFHLRDEGTYLFCLLRNHIQTETAGVYQVVDRELTVAEKRILTKQYQRVS